MVKVPWHLHLRPGLGPYCDSLLQDPELRPSPENSELREQMEEGEPAGLGHENDPHKDTVMVEQVDTQGVRMRMNWVGYQGSLREACHHPKPQ